MTRPLAELRDEVRRLAALQQLLDGEPDDGPIKGKVPIASATILALLDCAEALDGMLAMPMGEGRAQDSRVQRAVDACLALERAGWRVTP